MLRLFITFICHLVLRIFFRRIETVGRERVPQEGGVIFVVNHPNALVDPLFLLCLAERRVSFLAKSTLLKMPVIGALARALDTLPVYRQQDAGENTNRNSETFALARGLLARGGGIAIFPEGVSHNEPRLLRLKTGAARIALGAAATGEETANVASLAVKIVPVGLYYTAKGVFRSSALLHFGAPLDVPEVVMEADGEPPREAVAALSSEIETALGSLIINADCHETLARVSAAERIWSSASEVGEDDETPALHRELSLRRRFIEGYAFHRESLMGTATDSATKRVPDSVTMKNDSGMQTHAARRALAELETRVTRYDCLLRRADVDPRDLSVVERAPGALLSQVILKLIVIALLLPVALLGAITHYPAYRLIGFCARRFSRGSDDMLATIKMLAAVLLFPLTWLLLAVACRFYFGIAYALFALVILPLSAYIAMRFLEIEQRLGEQLRVLYVARLRARLFAELLAERRDIRAQIVELGNSILPLA